MSTAGVAIVCIIISIVWAWSTIPNGNPRDLDKR